MSESDSDEYINENEDLEPLNLTYINEIKELGLQFDMCYLNQ